MALPPGFLDDLRARVTLSDIVGRRVLWDSRKTNAARGDYWACCPFHEEKSPSFHVDDRKGFYHCFGCHASGDAIKFLTEHDNMGFMEAVAELAREAGLEMPAQDPDARERAEKGRGLVEWMEAAVAFYRTQLRGARAQAARDYLGRRGLTAQTQESFELGYAPPDRRGLCDALMGKGADVGALVGAGLIAHPEDGGAPYDRFRDRIMFPIRDARGRCIAFGGRAMSADARAKYLNSPETPLFDKSRTLYNAGPARVAAGRAGSLVVAEGYMDVIALVQAGVAHAVAPLGTAITAAQLGMMWRIADEPVIALDGDSAGSAAAMRVIDTALPLLEAGKSLRFAMLPPGLDPDDLIRAQGAGAMRAVLDAAQPMIDMLWRRETGGRSFDSPERRAALDARLRELMGSIADRAVRDHYRAALAERRAALFRPARPPRAPFAPRRGRGGPGAGFRAAFPETATPEMQASVLARAGPVAALARGREAAILLTLINHPDLIEVCGDDVAAAEFMHRDLDAVRLALLTTLLDAQTGTDYLKSKLSALIGRDVGDALLSAPHVGEMPFARAGVARKDAERGVVEALARHAAEATLRREVIEAEAALASEGGAEVDDRLRQAATAAQRDRPGTLPEEEGDESRLSQELRDAISGEIWVRKNRRRGDPNH
jgi:DNA primase